MMKNKLLTNTLITTALFALLSSANASTCCGTERVSVNGLFNLNFSGGLVNSAQSQTFFLQPEIEKTYMPINTKPVVFWGEMFLGLQAGAGSDYNSSFLFQLGGAVAYSSSIHERGNIWEDANEAFNNFTYGYDITHIHAAVKGKVLYIICDPLALYISGGLGRNRNTASNFTIVPLIPEEVPAPAFESGIIYSNYYSMGFGVQFMSPDNWQFGVGYEYSNWGKSQLGRAPGQTLNSGLAMNNLNVNSLNVNITYVFNSV
jgi:opacity protein-like surface antigen